MYFHSLLHQSHQRGDGIVKSRYYDLCICVRVQIFSLNKGTNINATDVRGVTPLHLAHSRLKIARESDDIGGEALSRKREICGIVEMLKEYLTITECDQEETKELEDLASRLTLSETPEQVRMERPDTNSYPPLNFCSGE